MPNVLSVQSHVVHGFVGNKSATFPLQLLGFNVDPLNSVHFSNHTGYSVFTGDRLEGDRLRELVRGLEHNGLLSEYSHFVGGYLGRVGVLEEVVSLVQKLPVSTLKLIDPVLGDNNHLYVPNELVPIYRDCLIPLADVITPNGFEAELLSGVSIKSTKDVFSALKRLHALGPTSVVITSVDLDEAFPTLTLFCSHSPSKQVYSIEFPKLKGSFTGTGDLFAALLLARLGSDTLGLKIDVDHLVSACELAVSTLHHVLNETVDWMKLKGVYNEGSSGERGDDNVKFRELRLIESKKWIESPTVLFKATLLKDE
ncbi:UNVERIFIED_CONTAM: hypothetical protein HDU68_007072 [Siphonaria sp. JEL0065]|nr:hypothetical protein HDU68_007072 [Siphonaria sp. JEL0065]